MAAPLNIRRSPTVTACALTDSGTEVLLVDDAYADEPRGHVKGLIAGYKAPRPFAFAESLPLTATGKILKRSPRRTRGGE
ncbi:hypothetical protein AB0G74_16115 [Streptomyces sp. NPDC020875]|uniref:hypothetical protein n=1 Tax=Streptomyces sp. NPDC020875 TaxID=3154898 RepID=UPI0033C29D01